MSNTKHKKDFHIPIVSFLNKFVQRITETTAWLNVVLIFVILLQVVLRYGFHRGLVPLEELMWHLYCIAFMFGMAYTMTKDSHIRVDLFHVNLPKKWQHIFEILGILFLLFPILLILFDHSFDWLARSYNNDEGSQNPSGLPNRWIIKSVIPLTMILMMIAALARLIEEFMSLLYLNTDPKNNISGKESIIVKLFKPQLKKHANNKD
jgi:TRAP-type mannitol/chloroaromatic compound transport system permease small subunit